MWISGGATTILIYGTRVHQLRQKYLIIFLEFYLRKGNFPYLGMRHKIISGHTLLCAETNLEVIGSCVSTSRIRMTDCDVLEILLRRRSNHCPATA